LQTLGPLANDLIPALIELTWSRDRNVRRQAASALEAIDGKSKQ
jgi:hypothetical protein